MKTVALGILVLGVVTIWAVYPFTSTAEPSDGISVSSEKQVDESAQEATPPQTGIVIEDAKQVAVRTDDGYIRELQWVLIRNHSDETIDLSGFDLRTEVSYSLAPNGLELVVGSFELTPGNAALIVTSPYVELDRGVAVEWRWVFTAIDEVDQPQLHPTDIEFVELVDSLADVLDFYHPRDVAGCCCLGDKNNGCATLFYGQKDQTTCYENGWCNSQPFACACWRAGTCPIGAPQACCDNPQSCQS